MTPRSYSLVMDMENGYGRSNDDEDDSKYRRPIHVIRWKRYSRGFYLAGFVVCLVVVLFILMLRVANGTDMDSTASSSVTGDETYKLMVVADLDTNSREKDDKKGKWKTILKKAELRRKELTPGLAITSDKGESVVAEDAVDLYENIDEYFILLTDKKLISAQAFYP